MASVRQLTSTYYALGDTRTPVVVAAIDLAVFIGLALGLRGHFGHVGIGLAVTGASLVQALLLWLWLGRRLPDLRLGEIGRSAARTLLAAGVAVLAARAVASALAGDESALGRALPGALGGACFVAVFLLAAWIVRSEELSVVAGPVLRLLRKKPAA